MSRQRENWFKYGPHGPFRFCWLAVDGLMAPARNAVDSETQKEIVLQVGPKKQAWVELLGGLADAARVRMIAPTF